MTAAKGMTAGEWACWRGIGSHGDRSCPHLPEYALCRNCPLYQEGGRQLLERPGEEAYLRELGERLAEPERQAGTERESILLFRLGGEWLGLAADLVVEVLEPRPVQPLPHRRNPLLRGVVNVSGRLEVCLSLARLLGFDEERGSGGEGFPRHLLLRWGEGRLVAPVAQVAGVLRHDPGAVRPPPATVVGAMAHHARGVWTHPQYGTVTLLSPGTLLPALREAML